MPKAAPKNDDARLQRAQKAMKTQTSHRVLYNQEGWMQAKDYKYSFKMIHRKAGTRNIPRKSPPSAVFDLVFPLAVIEEIVQHNNTEWKRQNINIPPIKSEEFRRFLRMRVRIMHRQTKSLPDNWKKGDKEHIGRDRYLDISNNLIVDVLALASSLTDTWAKLWKHGRYCTIDEDLEKQKKSPWRIRIEGKPGSPGHLMLLVSSRSEVHDKPFTTSILPHCSPKRANTVEAMQFAVKDIETSKDVGDRRKQCSPVLVMDTWFLSNESKKVLDESKVPFLAAIHSTRFKYLHIGLRKNAWKEAEWNTIWRPTTFEAATMFIQNGNKKYVLTNAFTKGAKHVAVPQCPPFTSEYRAWFNPVDKVNEAIGSIKYPHKQNPDHSFKFFDQIFRVGLSNVWVAYHDNIQEASPPTLPAFLPLLDADF
jgi:hypothetical protein